MRYSLHFSSKWIIYNLIEEIIMLYAYDIHACEMVKLIVFGKIILGDPI